MSFAYGHRIVLKNHLAVALHTATFLIIRGKNGSGKSTLVKCSVRHQSGQERNDLSTTTPTS
ncbi:MAG: hypothetical protein MZU97_22590 [Bacillus subtilis]|nr:hypothetical protein [Bacillus subtilis]